MAEFRSGLDVRVLDDDSLFQLTAPLVYWCDIMQAEIVVPVGFVTDFASIPWFFQGVIKVNGRHRKAAVLHDYLCVYKRSLGITQRCADQIFREAMRLLDVHWAERGPMYMGVRAYQETVGAAKDFITRYFSRG